MTEQPRLPERCMHSFFFIAHISQTKLHIYGLNELNDLRAHTLHFYLAYGKMTFDPDYTIKVLRQAIKDNSARKITLLARGGADLNVLDYEKHVPLCFASKTGQLRAVDALVDNGASVDGVEGGHAPIFCAISGRNASIVARLIARGANPNVHHRWYTAVPTPLHCALGFGKLPICRLLLQAGANMEARNANGETPLHLAVKVTFPLSAALLIENGANVNTVDKFGTSVLMSEMDRNDYSENVRNMLVRGADISVVFDEENAEEVLRTPGGIATCELVGIPAMRWWLHELPLDTRSCGVFDGTEIPATLDGTLPTREYFAQVMAHHRLLFGKRRFAFIRQSAATLCMALHNFRLPALVSVCIVEHAFLYTECVPWHCLWDLACAVKHFHDKKKER